MYLHKTRIRTSKFYECLNEKASSKRTAWIATIVKSMICSVEKDRLQRLLLISFAIIIFTITFYAENANA